MKAFHFHILVTQVPILIVEISNSLVFLCKGKNSNPEYRTVYGGGILSGREESCLSQHFQFQLNLYRKLFVLKEVTDD